LHDFRRDLRNWYLLNSHYDWQASAVGFIDAQMVTHYGVWGYDMRVGSSVIRCGGIGCVATDGEYRKRGLMAQTVPHSLKFMRDRGYDMTILFGVWDFYHRFGYTRAWNEVSWILNRKDIPADLPTIKYEQLEATPNPKIAELHNRENATVTGSAVRPTFTRGYCLFSGKLEVYAWKKAGRIVGHVHVNPGDRLICHEATGNPDDILSVLASLAQKKQLKEIAFHSLPYNSPLARRLRQLNCRNEKQYIKSGGAMIRLMNLNSTLKKIAPELSRRLLASEFADYRGQLSISSPEGAATLNINKGKVTLDRARSSKSHLKAGDEIAQLLIGTDEPLEICESAKIRLTGEAARLVPVLFPNQHPQLHNGDRY
jgi:predicted acetyltransferase